LIKVPPYPHRPASSEREKGAGAPFLAGAIVLSAQIVRNLIQIFVRKVFEKGLGKTFFKKFFPKKRIPAPRVLRERKRGRGPVSCGSYCSVSAVCLKFSVVICAESS